jgi:UDP-N-acetylmuramyl pentapeptide phosphotransferase/UDP-N-acetylglucosamine-1-phosphate transferase
MRDETITLGGLSAVAVVLIAAFAIDRLVAALLFLLSLWGRWDDRFNPLKKNGEIEREKAQRSLKLVYFLLAGALSVVVIIALDGKGILYHIGFKQHWIDLLLTALILMGGAERLAELLKGPGAAGSTASSDPPITITGTLQLEDVPKPTRAATGA